MILGKNKLTSYYPLYGTQKVNSILFFEKHFTTLPSALHKLIVLNY